MLTDHLLGFSPQVAKEVVFRATGGINTKAADTSARTLFGVIDDLFGAFKAHKWQPGVVIEERDQPARLRGLPVSFVDGWTPAASVSRAR